jgi:hypothetical protein
LCWADNQPGPNQSGQPLHVSFKLAKAGGDLGMFDPSGQKVDGFSYSTQVDDVSMGRYPDGTSLPLQKLDQPTPGAPNFVLGGNRPPVFDPLPAQTVAEGDQLHFAAHATDPDPGQIISYSLGTNAPNAALIAAQTGDVIWFTTENDGPGTYDLTVLATDNGAPPRTSTLHVTVNVTEVNSPPRLSPLPAQSVAQGETWTVQLQATDPDVPANHLAFSLDPGAPDGAQVDPATGLMTWTPSFSQDPQDYSLTARVTDDGTPPLSATATFTVTVRSGPKPPVIAPISPQTINELAPWQLTISAADPQVPPSALVYSLDVAPIGAQIDANTGIISWTPGEDQGPTNAVFAVRATRVAPPNLSAAATFSVNVPEVNRAPSLQVIPSQQVALGDSLILPVTATDPDLPANHLLFSLDPGAPAGMSIDAQSGQVQWTPSASQAPSTNHVTVRVTDDGVPPLSSAQSFDVLVQAASPWKFVSATGTASSSTVYIYLTAPGEVYVDDLMIVGGNEAELGPNAVRDGDFESALTGAWVVSPNLSGSALESTIKHSGKNALHVVATAAGTTRASAIYQDISPALASGAAYTLSFYYLPGTNDTSLTVRLSGSGINTVTPIKAEPALGQINVGLSTQGLPTFQWQTQVGRRYRIEFKNTLNDLVWQTLNEFVATGTAASATDQDAANAPERYYRVVLLP